MGAARMQLTVLATLIAEAVAKDETPEAGFVRGFDHPKGA